MKTFTIAIIPGDGVGNEVVPAARRVLDTIAKKHDVTFAFQEFDWGAGHFFRWGSMMPAGAIDLLQPCDAILLGAVGHPRLPDHTTLNGLLLPIRRAFDQYANVRPAYLYPGVSSPLAGKRGGEIDFVVVRENTEGEYAQVGGFVYHLQPEEIAIQTSVFTRRGIDRIVRFAFELAVKRNKKKRVTSITKSNAQGYSMVLWDRAFQEVAEEFPDVETESLLVDAAAMNFIRRPESFDVVVGSNLFCDILSDISAIIIGSMGLAASANLDPLRRFPSMFEPVHGSAPDIAGKGVVNPLATILSAGMMLDHLGMAEASRQVEAAVAAVLSEGQVRTPDLGGKSSTQEVTAAVLGETGVVAQAVMERTGRYAFLVSAGILITRLAGLVRTSIFLHFFGVSPESDAFFAAVKIPNFLQNILGEGALSASFIPVYSRLLAEGDREEADRVAGAVGAILSLTTAVLVLLGVLSAPWLIDVIAYGFKDPERRTLTIRLVRILFPGVGLLVPSAWCLGILNSHRKFFLSYTAPLAWNASMIATLLLFGGTPLARLAIILAWGSVVGSSLQFGVQLPMVMRLARHLRLSLDTHSEHVREVVRNFVPVFFSRGVVQISAYVDNWLATLVSLGAVTGLSAAQLLYTLPVSLFGMAVSAAELPAMSSALGAKTEVEAYLRRRLDRGLRQIAFFIVPSAMGFLAMGGVIAAALFQTGRFQHADSDYVWGILAGSSVGLLASTLGRLYSSTYYALRDTRTPLRFAVIRIALTASLGYVCALHLPRWIGIEPKWGVAGLTASAGVAGWVEFTLLRLTLNRRIGRTGVPAGLVARLWTAAVLAAGAGWGVKLAIGPHLPKLSAIPILGAYGAVYFGATYLLGVEECVGTLKRILKTA